VNLSGLAYCSGLRACEFEWLSWKSYLEGQAGDEDFDTDGAPSFLSQAAVDNDDSV
jgi:hypothetical protein